MIRAAAILLAAFLAGPAAAQVPDFVMTPIPAPAQPDAVPLYPTGTLPAGAVPESWTHITSALPNGSHVDGGRAARNVSIPTMTPVLPDPARATGAAVVVAPGGGFTQLAMDVEGYRIAHWLADHGIAAFVLKYRLNPTAADLGAFKAMMDRRIGEEIRDGTAGTGIAEPRAALDALRAIALVRDGAARWHVDPARVGIIGFSAGAMTAMQSVLTGAGAARPSFVGYVYGPMAAIPVPQGAPPLFAALALDDPLFGRQGFGIVDAWRKAGVPVELHAYEHGDHGFGMGRPETTSVLVMDEFRLWLETNGFLRGR